MKEYHIEPLLAGGYAVLLVLIAILLEWLARHSQKRSDRYETAGFRFHHDRDAWECPQGARLERSEIDHALRVIRYRAPAGTCNGCSIKRHCTNSERGRTISMPLDPWVRSAVARFQRGISLVLLTLAGLIVAIALVRHGHGGEGWALAGLLAGISLSGLSLASRLRDHKVGPQTRYMGFEHELKGQSKHSISMPSPTEPADCSISGPGQAFQAAIPFHIPRVEWLTPPKRRRAARAMLDLSDAY